MFRKNPRLSFQDATNRRFRYCDEGSTGTTRNSRHNIPGGALTLLTAATHPERISNLFISSGYVTGHKSKDSPFLPSTQKHEARVELRQSILGSRNCARLDCPQPCTTTWRSRSLRTDTTFIVYSVRNLVAIFSRGLGTLYSWPRRTERNTSAQQATLDG